MIASTNSRRKIFHEEWCPYAKRIDGKYRLSLRRRHALRNGYHECAYCGGLRSAYHQMLRDPVAYGKPKGNFTVCFENRTGGLCFRTDVGFWKVLDYKKEGQYLLYHLNKNWFINGGSNEKLMLGQYHRQNDVAPTDDLSSIVMYVRKHDEAMKRSKGNWRNLPRSTKQQKAYYEKARKRAAKNEHRRLDQIFRQLENERRK